MIRRGYVFFVNKATAGLSTGSDTCSKRSSQNFGSQMHEGLSPPSDETRHSSLGRGSGFHCAGSEFGCMRSPVVADAGSRPRKDWQVAVQLAYGWDTNGP